MAGICLAHWNAQAIQSQLVALKKLWKLTCTFLFLGLSCTRKSIILQVGVYEQWAR